MENWEKITDELSACGFTKVHIISSINHETLSYYSPKHISTKWYHQYCSTEEIQQLLDYNLKENTDTHHSIKLYDKIYEITHLKMDYTTKYFNIVNMKCLVGRHQNENIFIKYFENAQIWLIVLFELQKQVKCTFSSYTGYKIRHTTHNIQYAETVQDIFNIFYEIVWILGTKDMIYIDDSHENNLHHIENKNKQLLVYGYSKTNLHYNPDIINIIVRYYAEKLYVSSCKIKQSLCTFMKLHPKLSLNMYLLLVNVENNSHKFALFDPEIFNEFLTCLCCQHFNFDIRYIDNGTSGCYSREKRKNFKTFYEIKCYNDYYQEMFVNIDTMHLYLHRYIDFIVGIDFDDYCVTMNYHKYLTFSDIITNKFYSAFFSTCIQDIEKCFDEILDDLDIESVYCVAVNVEELMSVMSAEYQDTQYLYIIVNIKTQSVDQHQFLICTVGN